MYQLEVKVGASPDSLMVKAAPLAEEYVMVPELAEVNSDDSEEKSMLTDVPRAVSASQDVA